MYVQSSAFVRPALRPRVRSAGLPTERSRRDLPDSIYATPQTSSLRRVNVAGQQTSARLCHSRSRHTETYCDTHASGDLRPCRLRQTYGRGDTRRALDHPAPHWLSQDHTWPGSRAVTTSTIMLHRGLVRA